MDLITTPFGFASTAAEVAAGIDLSGHRAVVTGAASGIGVETARALASAGCEVELDGIGGRYFVDCNETPFVDKRSGTLCGVARYAIDVAKANRLSDLSEALVANASNRPWEAVQ
jgi:NAD(P)-dependent dehydrogenase (short-subunit alcohol dehydrogenase family)